MQKSEILDALSLLGSIVELPNLTKEAKDKANQTIIKLLTALDTALIPLTSSLKLS